MILWCFKKTFGQNTKKERHKKTDDTRLMTQHAINERVKYHSTYSSDSIVRPVLIFFEPFNAPLVCTGLILKSSRKFL